MNEENKCGCGHDHENNGCGCGHDHNEHECGCGHEPIIVELEGEDGNLIKCEVVDGFTFNEKEYAVVHNPEDEMLYIFEVVFEGDEGQLVVPGEDEFDKVSEYYETILEEDSIE